jgi:hypothetical protein
LHGFLLSFHRSIAKTKLKYSPAVLIAENPHHRKVSEHFVDRLASHRDAAGAILLADHF